MRAPWSGLTFRFVRPGSVLAVAAVAVAATGACLSGGGGSPPPLDRINFPVGLAVSKGGGVLYVANADFDLQYGGGTLQAYDLNQIRRDALDVIAGDYEDCARVDAGADAGSRHCLALVHGLPSGCPGSPADGQPDDASIRVPLGQSCAPPVKASEYVRNAVVIGAFATTAQLTPDKTRLFVPVRGTSALTWADVTPDDPDKAPGPANFAIDCGQKYDGQNLPTCNLAHAAGVTPSIEPGNTRYVSMPGEPFGLAFTPDGTAAVLSHQSDTKTSLFSTGLGGAAKGTPALQYVLDGVPTGGIGVIPVPHATCASPDCPPAVRPSFLLTSRSVAQLSLLRYYSDVGTSGTASSQLRPFLMQEQTFAITAATSGVDSRGGVIDPTPRFKCVSEVPPAGGARTQADVDRDIAACQRLPARVFIANRTPASLIMGEMGGVRTDGAYDPDRLVLFGNMPLPAGPSNVYLAPIVDRDGRYALRVFVVCYDAQMVLVIDPDTRSLESLIVSAVGPFAMAFDPFDLEAVARREKVPQDSRWPDRNLKRYRFAYIGSFLNSFIQVLDLDGSLADKSTFESVVFTLGAPTTPKGS